MMDYELYGLNPWGYHLTNLLLHTTNTLLVFLVFMRITGYLWQSAFVAAVFALHPLHVESVAWISERKDVLSTLFWMLTMWAYLHYTERPGLGRNILVVVLFALGLMTKPMLVTLPFALILIDWWPLRRFNLTGLSEPGGYRGIWKIFKEKIPILALAVASSVITYLVQHKGGSTFSIEQLSLWARISNALTSYTNYIWKTIWPANLAVFYPHPMDNIAVWEALGAGFLLVCLTVMAIRTMHQHPYLTVGWLWFLGTLIPVIGLVQVGRQAMADRYMYIPLIGLSIIIAWGIPEFFRRLRWRKELLIVSAGIVLSALMVCTWFQLRHWRNSTTLFEHAIKVTADNGLAHYNLGAALVDKGKNEEALAHLLESLRIEPYRTEAHNNLGVAYHKLRRLEDAIREFETALELKPQFADAHYNLGIAFGDKGDSERAFIEIQKAMSLSEKFVEELK
jgi:hypothetical protein